MGKTKAPEGTSCIWKLDDKCDGDILLGSVLGQLSTELADVLIPICERHLEQHERILDLYNRGLVISDIMVMSDDERKQAQDKLNSEADDAT